MNQPHINNIQQQNDYLIKEKSLNQFLEEQNPNSAINESISMRKAIRTYFDSSPFSTSILSINKELMKQLNIFIYIKVNPEKSKCIQISCSQSDSGDNSDIITTHSQNNQQYGNESDNELELFDQMQLVHKFIHNVKDDQYQQNNSNSQFVSKNSYDTLQKAYHDLQQKYFNVKHEIKENQNQLCSLLSELRSQQNTQQNQINYQTNEMSISSKLEEKFTSQINRAFRLMYENLKEESEKTIEQKNSAIKQLECQISQYQKMNDVLVEQNEQKENALMDIVQYYSILKQQIEAIKQEREQLHISSPTKNIESCKKTQKYQSDSHNQQSILSSDSDRILINMNSNILKSPKQNIKNIENLKNQDIQLSPSIVLNAKYTHESSGFSFAPENSVFQQGKETQMKESDKNNMKIIDKQSQYLEQKNRLIQDYDNKFYVNVNEKENYNKMAVMRQESQYLIQSIKQQMIQEFETFKTEEMNPQINTLKYKDSQQQQLQDKLELNKNALKIQTIPSFKQFNDQITSQSRLNSQIDTNHFDDQSETVFEDNQTMSAQEWQSNQTQQNQILCSKLPQFGEENYISNDISSSIQINNLGKSNFSQDNKNSSTPNKSFKQLNDYLQTHETNFEQEHEEIDLINQKVKKSNRLNMLAKLKKEVFQEGLKTALNSSGIQTSRKSSNTTPRKQVTQKNNKASDQILSSRSRNSRNNCKYGQQQINQNDDPIQRGYMIIENLYHSIEKRFQNQQ